MVKIRFNPPVSGMDLKNLSELAAIDSGYELNDKVITNRARDDVYLVDSDNEGVTRDYDQLHKITLDSLEIGGGSSRWGGDSPDSSFSFDIYFNKNYSFIECDLSPMDRNYQSISKFEEGKLSPFENFVVALHKHYKNSLGKF